MNKRPMTTRWVLPPAGFATDIAGYGYREPVGIRSIKSCLHCPVTV